MGAVDRRDLYGDGADRTPGASAGGADSIRRLLHWLKWNSILAAQRFRKGHRTFTFGGKSYRYLLHGYNRTYWNERAVEVPVVLRIVEQERGAILEVGNVLGHYRRASHDVLDKYEVAPGAINADVADWTPARPYDLIVSISTLEHIGWDEARDPEKVGRVVERIRTWLAPEGRAVVTWPLGYNPSIDALIDTGTFSEIGFLARISADNRWAESDREGIRGAAYGSPHPLANAIAVATLRPASPIAARG
jgi:hypothetical protein